MSLQRRTPLSSGRPLKRTPLARRAKTTPDRKQLRRTPIAPMSPRRRAENRVRRERMHEAFGENPRCVLCAPLAAAGIRTGCNGWADDADEVLRRAAGGSITEPLLDGRGNVRPVGRLCHSWVTEHPTRARELGLVAPRYR